jgi:lysozyme
MNIAHMNPIIPLWTPGIDVSHWQSVIAWGQVKTTGVQFAYIKATDGSTGVDSHFAMNRAESAGVIPRGAYHFFRMETVSSQMRNFEKCCGDYTLELPPALDLEVGPMDAPELKQVLLFLNVLEQYAGRIPVLYVDLANALKITDPEFARYPLWLADYSTKEPIIPDTPFQAQWTFWQHTPQGQISGVPNAVDLDWFNGTPEQLLLIGNTIRT